MRLPIPWLLALTIVLGTVTVYIYIHVIPAPVVPAVAPTTTTVSIPAGQWYIVGPVAGDTITIKTNVTANILVAVGSAVAVANSLPSGLIVSYTDAGNRYTVVNYTGVYALGVNKLCMAGTPTTLSSGLVLLTPSGISSSSYSTYSQACNAVGAPLVFNGTVAVNATPSIVFYTYSGPVGPAVQYYYTSTTSVSLSFNTYHIAEFYNQTNYYWYIRPAVWVAINPSANANVTITVSTST